MGKLTWEEKMMIKNPVFYKGGKFVDGKPVLKPGYSLTEKAKKPRKPNKYIELLNEWYEAYELWLESFNLKEEWVKRDKDGFKYLLIDGYTVFVPWYLQKIKYYKEWKQYG